MNLLDFEKPIAELESKLTDMKQLADELGTTREAVSRVLKQMENAKLISLSRNRISLL